MRAAARALIRPASVRSPSIDAKVEALSATRAYAEAPGHVEAIETHMSWVFRTDRFAYKLKKPVRYGLVDFGTLIARRRACEAELRLNQRLGQSVYLAVVPLALDDRGRLAVAGAGRAVDWLVKMRRLPDALMLDRQIRDGVVSVADVRRAAEKLARFYLQLHPVPMRSRTYYTDIRRDLDLTQRELTAPRYGFPEDQVLGTWAAQQAALEHLRDVLEARARDQKIVEGHGDLRPEHVCLEPEPVVIDCLEFHRRLRVLDPVDDLAFLTLECGRLGRPDLHRVVFDAYAAVTRDAPSVELVHFYQSYRALLRAKLAAWHLREDRFRHSDHWRERARQYLELAHHHVAFCR